MKSIVRLFLYKIDSLPVNPGEADFDRRLAITVRAAVLSLTGLIYAAALLGYVTRSTHSYKLALFAAIVTLIPLGVAFVARALEQKAHEINTVAFKGCALLVFTAATLLVCAAVLMHVFRPDVNVWSTIVRALLLFLVGIHLTFLAMLYATPGLLRFTILPALQRAITLDGRISADVSLTCYALVALLLVFRVEPNNHFLNVAFSAISELSPRPQLGVLIAAPVAAIIIILACFHLIRFEATCAITHPLLLHRIRRVALALCTLAIFSVYFDFAFSSDTLHFLTNVGPAAQIIHASSVPMVTAFSQYGPGPLLMTWLTFLAMSPSFHAANIVSQLCSLTFYAVILICLYRMTSHRLAALLLGFFAIGILLAGWWGGGASLNAVPSSMGMRYLPNALLVLAISFLPKGHALSPAVFASMMLATLWSYETLAGSAYIFGAFILILALGNRNIVDLIKQGFAGVVLPVAASVTLMSAMTLVWTGTFPHFSAYLAFLRAYSPVSNFWALDGNGTFLGWILVAITGMTALALSCFAAFGSRASSDLWISNLQMQRFAPMALLTAFMSSYFVGRSVDFTLIIAFMPMVALVIPTILTVFRAAMQGNHSAKYLLPVACIAIFVPFTFSVAALYRKGSPYALPIAICLHERVCSPMGLANLARTRYRLQPMLDQQADPTFFEPNGIASEAINLINTFAADRKQIPLFLGIHPATIWSVHTNAVLVLTGKGHRWPISYVLSDEINPVLRGSIMDADVTLHEGEPVFIRKDESRLGELEAAIVRQIRANVRLCLLADGKAVSSYRATRQPSC